MSKSSGKSGSGFLAGLVFLFIGVSILWNNEERTVKTQKAINEAKKVYIDVKSNRIDKKNEGKLVATKGKLSTKEDTILKDKKYGISVNAIKMKRNVEMYQWDEDCETDDNDNTKCTYKKVWSDTLIDSEDFQESGHENPTSFSVDSDEYVADEVKLGEYILPEELVKKLKYNKKKDSEELTNEYNNSSEKIIVSDRYLTDVKEDNPEIGNIRISYLYLSPITVSVMGVQTDNTFEAFTSKKGADIYTIVEGNKTGAQILEDMQKSNKIMKWILRFLGTFVIIISFNSMFSFLNTITSKIPVLGSLVSGATNLISDVLGISISLVVIAVAWFRFRPVLSITLLLVGAALIIGAKYFVPQKEDTREVKKKATKK